MSTNPHIRRIVSCPSLSDQTRTDSRLFRPTYKSRSDSTSSTNVSHTKLHFDDYLEDTMDKDPGSHFLVEDDYEPYQCRFGQWDDSDYDDDEDGEDDDGNDPYDLNPHIIDFSLFSAAAHRAKETHQPLSPQWRHLIQSQQGAYQRTLQRTQTSPIPMPKPRFLADLPDLTPDSSPHLLDDVDETDDSSMGLTRPDITHGLDDILVVSDGSKHSTIDDEDEYHSSAPARRHHGAKLLGPHAHRLRRPGLRSSRTLSGHTHSWRRPSYIIPTVREEPEECEECGRLGTTWSSAAENDELDQICGTRGRSRYP